MNFTQLVNRVATNLDKPNTAVQEILDSAFSEIETEILQGNQVRIRGFGIFECRWTKPRNRVSVNKGNSIFIPGHFSLKFRPSPAFKVEVANTVKETK